jgi:hypothetical protein
MTDDNHEFTTDSSPGEQAFENTVNDAIAFFEAAFDANESGYNTAMMGQMGSGITNPKGTAESADHDNRESNR